MAETRLHLNADASMRALQAAYVPDREALLHKFLLPPEMWPLLIIR